MERKRDIAILGIIVVILAAVMFSNTDLSGHASKAIQITRDLDENEYDFYIGDTIFIQGSNIKLVNIGDSKEAIVDVSGVQKSVNEYGTRIINNFQIENVASGENHVVLKINNLNEMESKCVDNDEGDIYLKGNCIDNFYPEGISDFCDFSYLREYSCGYDEYVDEVHCLKHIVECVDGCKNGACVVR